MFDVKQAIKRLKHQGLIVYFVAKDPQSRGLVKWLAIVVAAYTFSPVDLIPDFIPVIGLLDEVLLLVLFYSLIVKLTPPHVLESADARALAVMTKPTSVLGAVIVVMLWVLIGVLFLLFLRSLGVL